MGKQTNSNRKQMNRGESILRAGMMTAVSVATASSLVACGKSGGSSAFSTLATATSYHQADAVLNNKIDILWVVDNSGSMDPLQSNLTSNFSSFITNFQNKGFDYKIAVTGSDAYLAGKMSNGTSYGGAASIAQFKQGSNGANSGVRVIVPSTPNLIQTFVTNATTGSVGSGDERIFQSITSAMSSSLNTGFLRAGAFFAVVLLSDEDDFTNYTRAEGAGSDHNYNQTGLLAVNDFITSLDTLTSSTVTNRQYNVSAITVEDSACQASHSQAAPSSIIGTRYMDLVNKTNGILGSVCDSSFANSLSFIQQRIVELSTSFKLDSIPKQSTIVVTVNGSVIANSTTSGWTYSSDSNSITFHGSSVPAASATVNIAYDPDTFL